MSYFPAAAPRQRNSSGGQPAAAAPPTTAAAAAAPMVPFPPGAVPMQQVPPGYGGLYPAAVGQLDPLSAQGQMAAFSRQQAVQAQAQAQVQAQAQAQVAQQQMAAVVAGAAPLTSAALPAAPFGEDAVMAAQRNMVANNMANMQTLQTMQNMQAMQTMAAQNIAAQSVAAAHGLVTTPLVPATPVTDTEEEIDVGSLPLPDLLNKINPGLMADMRVEAPAVLEGLLQQFPTQQQLEAAAVPLPPTTAGQLAAAAAAATPIDPDAMLVAAAAALPGQPALPVLPPTAADFPYAAAGMVPGVLPAGDLAPGVPVANGANGSAPAPAKASRPRVGQKRGKAPEATIVKQELTAMTGVFDMPHAADDDGSENNEDRKAMRAERNRQSAAASRERKKNHIKELERRVTMLSQQNAKLQVEQLDAIRHRIGKEQRLSEENKSLRLQAVTKDLKIHELTNKLEKAGIDPPTKKLPEIQELNLKRPSTWGSSSWKESKFFNGENGT